MSKEHTSLPIQNHTIGEKHDPISGHAPTSRASPPINHPSNGNILPGGTNAKPNEKKLHPAIIIVIWIAMSSAVIGKYTCVLSLDRDLDSRACFSCF